jgi:endonuclease-3
MAEGLPLESNGLRVLVRMGYGREQKAYGAMYRSVENDLTAELKTAGAQELSLAHRLLREHGKTLCKDKNPHCGECPLLRECDYGEKRFNR